MAEDPSRRAWVIVRPEAEGGFHIVYLEIGRQDSEEILRTAQWENGQIHNRQSMRAGDQDELVRILSNWLPDLTKLVDPYVAQWPL